MTAENKKKNVAEELTRAAECLKEADALHQLGFQTGAVSRLYYFVFHSVRALLLAEGLEPKTHEGTLRLLGMHFIKTGTFDASLSHVYAKLMKFREEADYNASSVFTKDDYVIFKKEAISLHETICKFLKDRDLA